ncbi:unnamed protein product [Toxocara canis]|uniref:AraC family transcriptional regulator n=1 Tax=Toxocara canis TaxID=6265 RepID=A0A183TX64_TOXCA|nr:unnamed protein product [Toxocara canis]
MGAAEVYLCADDVMSQRFTAFHRHFAKEIGAEDELCLLADTLRIRLEIFDCTISAKNESPSMHLYPDAENSFPVLSFIKANDRYLYSVYYMAD